MLTRAQIAALEKGIAVANFALQKIELLAHLGKLNPALAQRADELRTKRDYLHSLCETALEFDRQFTGQAASR